MKSKNRIQSLLIDYLLKNGSIDLNLPDGFVLEIGVDKEMNQYDEENDYCWVSTTHESRSTVMDKYSMSLSYDHEDVCFVNEDEGMVDVI